MMKLRPLAAAIAIAAVLAGVYRRSGYTTYGLLDTAILVVFLVFFWWLISDFSRRKARVDADGRQSTDGGIAFRFGRFLRRVFRRSNRGL
ncbi:hypothetical protein [Mesorhizobium sp. LSHC412B00]|uniref:hypothetical protein n=1 Tax=Mesorhizobium sp. LSHC412B00 TaxID=1287285 RepID=UPI0003CEE34B|nr:hypothetical protein [Mesorhizobium sp. LSHC412B00]ESX83765.1 hypothetical protein X756_29150 [Mesorhizobium sp. LSHC412B00]